jgi:hypothetical protein
MARSPNAQIAVSLYEQMLCQHGWNSETAWRGIAWLLLSCEVWNRGWQSFHDVVVYREVNDFKLTQQGAGNVMLRRAEALSALLADELGIPRPDLSRTIGMYWRQPGICDLQPNNLVGHAFRSLTVTALERFGCPGVNYSEEVDPHEEFPGFAFATRSKKPKLDIVARRGAKTVALISTRWRFRHDRVDVVEEALAYATAAHRHNANCRLYAMTGEFAPNRLDKILSNCPPAHPHPALAAAVHFAPLLITRGLGENGRMAHLKGLDWLISETFNWH